MLISDWSSDVCSSDLDESIFAGLMNAVNWFDEAFQNSLEAAGYARTTRVESFVIVNIAAGRQRPADIARNLGVSRQAISQILKAFAQRGWIETLPDPNHRSEEHTSELQQ